MIDIDSKVIVSEAKSYYDGSEGIVEVVNVATHASLVNFGEGQKSWIYNEFLNVIP